MSTATPQTPAVSADAKLPQELVASASFLLKRLGYAAKERTMSAWADTGLHPYHYAVLLVLDEGSRETQGSIADALGYDHGQLVGLLDELQDQELVERQRDPKDRRRHLVSLTAEGKKTLRRLRALAARLDDEFLEPLSESERATLHSLLLRLAEVHEPRCAPLER